ncbi:acyl-CoA N-acyltransferase [Aspergillus karnatakaensis]|uniref:GNAT family N-acetyltransferase n=1 Tax=Aspergillus karnatakaensis TaxID=1810916 RepID=UPI003CCCBF92
MGSLQLPTKPPYTLRTHRPGDMGYITYRHGLLYSQEYNWGSSFESVVAKVTADFLEDYDAQRERCWIAERDGVFLGCIMLVRDRESGTDSNVAKLRVLLVEPAARGLGLGSRLVAECTKFAREIGYERIRLWTSKELVSARRLYEKEGYKLVKSFEQESFQQGRTGDKSIGEHWELVL